MEARPRSHRIPRAATFTRTPPKYLAWALGIALFLFLLVGFADMVLCGVEEDLKPSEVCGYCVWHAKYPDRCRPGCGGEYGPANRVCPTCGREWGSFYPYYLKWLRDPIREHCGRLHF